MSRRSWVTAAMWMTWLTRRFPARERRCRLFSPEEASRGAVPFQDASGDDGADAVQLHQV